MTHCSRCGVERRHVGILYPTRHLCACENCTCCSCKQKAIVVEFQAPLKGAEPPLPPSSNTQAKFYCKTHCPEDFLLEATPIPEKTVLSDEENPSPRTAQNVKGAPHIDPVWERASPKKSPMGSDSRLSVACVTCKHAHRLKDRKLWNGSYSYCPKCGETMYVPTWNEEDTRGQDK